MLPHWSFINKIDYSGFSVTKIIDKIIYYTWQIQKPKSFFNG